MKDIFASLQPHGMLLPQMVFFDPLPNFVPRIKALKPKLVVDVGAGVGRMSATLHKAGVKVLAIDICVRKTTEHDIAPLDALTIQYPSGSLPIMARPCHGPWTDFAIDHAMSQTKTMVYVGLPKNIDGDIDTEIIEEKQ